MDARDVFEILIRDNADLLMAFIRATIRDATLADDVFQETMLTAWRRLPDYDKSRPFGPWLRGIAGNVIMTAHRQSKRGTVPCDGELLDHLSQRCEWFTKSRQADTLDEKLDALRDCVQALPDAYRQAIESRLLAEDESSESVAARLGVGLETLKKRLQRARSRLLDCLQRKLSPREVLS